MSITLDVKQGIASDLGEYWEPNEEENPNRVLVDMSITENLDAIEFSFDGKMLTVPLDRLKKLLRGV